MRIRLGGNSRYDRTILHVGSGMGKHHHHPHEGHSAGNEPGTGETPLRHNWFFYVSALFIFLALVGFILTNNLNFQPGPSAPPAPAADRAGH